MYEKGIASENLHLERFECKKPEYEFVTRLPSPLDDVCYEARRYRKKEAFWASDKETRDTVRLMFTGDITCFGKQFSEAARDTGYDFNYEFDAVRPIFDQADLVVGNLETMIFPNAPYRSEKLVSEQHYYCNAPLEFLDAVRQAGFDLVTTANNHDLDTGAIGIGETIDNIERFGLIQTGTFKTEKKRFTLLDVCGFKIAIIAFATEHNHLAENLTREGESFLLQTYSKEKAAWLASEARSYGAELVITCIHWGQEHKLEQNKSQEKMVKELVIAGYDCIIGSHPHVLQPFTIISSGQKKIPVFYSMGNFVSHNVRNNRARSIIACVDLKRTEKGISIDCSYIPVYTSDIFKGKRYVVLPISQEAKESRNMRRRTLIGKILGDEIQINKGISFEEYIDEMPAPGNANKQKKPDLTKITEFPFVYTTGGFTYQIYKDHACVLALAPTVGSTTLPGTVLDLPITESQVEAFAGHPGIGKIILNNMREISAGMMKGCSRLEGLRFGARTQKIGNLAFANCPMLTAVVLRRHIKTIGNGAFRNCPRLKTVKIPPNVVEIAEDAFERSDHVTIYCEKGSYAEEFAKRKGIPFQIMELLDR